MIYIAQIKERRTGGNHVDTRTASGVEGNMAKPSHRLIKSVRLTVRTSGFQPDNTSSILVPTTIPFYLSEFAITK